MFGTDYPFDIGDPEAKRALPALNRLADGPKEQIFHGNAEAVLKAVRRPGNRSAG
jgi:aminocarboxymuconate-semialdehyde decarboxylase